jgi:spermidine/putrescine transport system permease protein
MIPSLPRPLWLRIATVLFVAAFLVFLFLPLVTVAAFAFNDAPYPAPPWQGFTLDWFTGNEAKERTGLFRDEELMGSILTSLLVAAWVTLLSVVVGTTNAFLMERMRFRGQGLLSGLPLVVLGQVSYLIAIATLTISARLKRFDRTLEEAAYNLGASRPAVLATITLPYLRPALIGSGAIVFLMSFENFNTTLMLVGADSPLTVMMYGRMRDGATPVLNAVSVFLMVASAAIALLLMRGDGRRRG